jgi:acyl-CoA reductase-like NAD-dependent aldehyde dehydrogenase
MADARAKGATIHYGGSRATGLPTNLYYQPTIISGVTTDMLLNREETFGPVAPVLSFEDEDDAIRIAETCPLGLHGSIWTNGIGRALRMAERLRCGTVHVNETSAYWQLHTPTGGFSGTGSGIGRIGGMATLEEMTQLKTISLNVVGT